MKLGIEDRKKLATLGVVGVLGLGAIFYIYSQLFEASAPTIPPAQTSSPATIPGGTSRAASGEYRSAGVGLSQHTGVTNSAALDPTLRMGPMLVAESLVYSGTGRNIFSMNSAPAPLSIPKPIGPARPQIAPPAAVQPSGPPPLPAIDLKFFGTETSTNGQRQAFLLHGEDVFLASDGDVVQRRYKILSIAPNSIVIEDLTNSNRQSLPLLTN